MPIPINIFLHKRVSLELALLFEYIFKFSDKFTDKPIFKTILTQTEQCLPFKKAPITIDTEEFKGGGYLLIPPMVISKTSFIENKEESDFLAGISKTDTTIATSCLGAFIPAAAGMLNGKEATTHWNWLDYAKENFPDVKWDTASMLCDKGDLITSGGLLSLIDLALYIISKHTSKEFTSNMGKYLLADTVRQKQSVYAQSLVSTAATDSRFIELSNILNSSPEQHIEVSEMADMCGMSLRNFHRSFVKDFGTTPNKYIQLKRLEKAKKLLAETDKSVEQIAGESGFADTSFFRSVFSRETGLTPTQYRKKMT